MLKGMVHINGYDIVNVQRIYNKEQFKFIFNIKNKPDLVLYFI